MTRTIRRVGVMALVCLLLAVPEGLFAAGKDGAQLIIVLKNDEVVEGELVGVRDETLVVLTDTGDRKLDLSEVSSLIIKNMTGRIAGGAVGLAAGGVADISLYLPPSARKCSRTIWQLRRAVRNPLSRSQMHHLTFSKLNCGKRRRA